MKNKIYLAALFLSWSCLTTGASAQEVQETYDSFQQQEENIIRYQNLIKEEWNNTKAHNDLGEVYLKLRRLEEAEKAFKAAKLRNASKRGGSSSCSGRIPSTRPDTDLTSVA